MGAILFRAMVPFIPDSLHSIDPIKKYYYLQECLIL